MEFVLLIIGIVVGGIIGFLWAKSKLSQENSQLQNEITGLQTDKEYFTKEIHELEEAIESQKKAQDELLEQTNKLKEEKIQLAAELKYNTERFEQYKKEAVELKEQLLQQFKATSHEVIKQQSVDFSERNANILAPFKEQLNKFEQVVNQSISIEKENFSALKEHFEQMRTMNQKISDEANNLTKALKGDTKLQGNWGELILEKVLEKSNLQKGSEYETQFSTVNPDGKRIQPDVVVHLPEGKHVIIDSKVSLVAYEKYVSSETEEEQQKALKDHVASLRAHVKGLSDKKYPEGDGFFTPDFVLMFIPIESSFGIAVKEDIDLFNFAWERNIVLVSPSTLLATLRTISSIWKQEKQNRNVLEIAEESGKLYDKFVGFVEDLDKIEKNLAQTASQFDDAKKKLHTGRGNLVGKVERIKKLGAKATKQIDEKYLDED
jgi:DNA recombination protein RmuC